jgi:uncharacterized protein YciW
MAPSTPFSTSSESETITVNVPEEYAQWLRSQADQRDVSMAEIVKALVDSHRKKEARRAARGEEPEESVAESLRSANERLRKLVDRADSLDEEPSDTLQRLRDRLGGDGQDSEAPSFEPSADRDDDAQSMFDLMDE